MMNQTLSDTRFGRLGRLLLGALIVAGFAATYAADYETGLSAYRKGDFATALAQWQPLSEDGDPRAEYHLGIMHVAGEGVDISLPKAVEFYRSAAEKGLGEAQNALAFMYRVGNGVPQSDEDAVKWYKLAADQGIGQAQYNLGAMYGAGKGTEQDYVQAYKWFSLAVMHRQDKARQALHLCMDNLSEEQVAEAKRIALEWRPKVNNLGELGDSSD